jgi:hypothetical protein
MRFWNCFRFELAPKRAAAAIATVCLCVASAAAEGRPRHRPIGPVVVRDPVPYWRQYFGPPTSYGSPYYRMMAPRYFAPPPPYVGYGYNSYGYNGYGYGSAAGYVYPGPYVGFGVTAPAPLYRTQVAPRVDLSNPALQETLLENQLRWGTELPPNAFPSQTRVRIRPSTPEKQAKSIHAQAEGDVYMKRLRFLNAYEKFKYAVGVANDRPEPYFRLAYALAAIGSYDSAVKYLKQGITLDPQWPVHGEKLIGVFGDDNRLAVLSLIERVTGWVRDDIRDPDRLFLMGVLLHFNDDNRAGQFFEAAYRLAGGGDHLLVFLQPQLDARENAAAAGAQGPGHGSPPPAPEEPPLTIDQIPGAAITPPSTRIQPSGPTPAAASPKSPAPIGPPRNTVAPIPRRIPSSPPSTPTPVAPATKPTAPPANGLPLPPLPAPADPTPNPQSSSHTPAPAGGPSLFPTPNSNTTVQTP